MEKYKWDRKEFLSLAKEILSKPDDYSEENFDNYFDKEVMIYLLFGRYTDNIQIDSMKDILINNNDYVINVMTAFQRDLLDGYIDLASKEPVLLVDDTNTSLEKADNDKIFRYIYDILSGISPELLHFAENEVKQRNINISVGRSSSRECSISNKRFYIINRCKSENPVVDILHELMHGYLDKITNRMFDRFTQLDIYSEATSLLIELYGSDYLLSNRAIGEFEHLYILNKFITRNITDDIDQIKVLYEFAKLDETAATDKQNLKTFFDFKIAENPFLLADYRYARKYPLESVLKYLYSCMLALSIYHKYPNNPATGMQEIIKYVTSITTENELSIYKDADIKPKEALNAAVIRHNKIAEKYD